jgi:(E)-4-hydroxy-3-methylbut-2-enyl-diphosphate synthase
VPIVADVHFHFSARWKRSRPACTRSASTPATSTTARRCDVIQACKAKKLPIRIGVNEGSIVERKDKQKRLKELGGVFSDNKHGHFLAIMITKLEEYLDIFHEQDFHDIVISAKSIDPLLVIDAYKAISERFDYPLHLGVTHAGPKETGTIRSVVPLGTCSPAASATRSASATRTIPVYEVRTAWSCCTCSACARASAPS